MQVTYYNFVFPNTSQTWLYENIKILKKESERFIRKCFPDVVVLKMIRFAYEGFIQRAFQMEKRKIVRAMSGSFRVPL